MENTTKTCPDHAHNLTPWEINALIDRFLYSMTPSQRAMLMLDMPSVYNRLVGTEVCQVQNGGGL